MSNTELKTLEKKLDEAFESEQNELNKLITLLKKESK